MAEIYKHVNGQKLSRFIAGNVRVQAAIRTHAQHSRTRGNRLLSEHVHAGHSYVTAERANALDWLVTLNDPSGPDPAGKYPDWMGAMSIEYGRWEDTNSPWGPMAGLYILHRAVGKRTATKGRKGSKARVKVPGGGRGFIHYE